MTATTTKKGRPARTKESLFAEIQRHKSYNRDLLAELDSAYDTVYAYRTASLVDRIKYVIKKEI